MTLFLKILTLPIFVASLLLGALAGFAVYAARSGWRGGWAEARR